LLIVLGRRVELRVIIASRALAHNGVSGISGPQQSL